MKKTWFERHKIWSGVIIYIVIGVAVSTVLGKPEVGRYFGFAFLPYLFFLRELFKKGKEEVKNNDLPTTSNSKR